MDMDYETRPVVNPVVGDKTAFGACRDDAPDACLPLLAGNAARLLPLIAPLLEAMGYGLVRLRLSGEGGQSRILQVMAEPTPKAETGRALTIKDCTEISHAVSAALDAEDSIAGRYRLEVSSPGLARPLTRREDFHTYANRTIDVQLHSLWDGHKKYQGILQGLDGDKLQLMLPDSQLVVVPLSHIQRATLVVLSDDIQASLRQAKRARKDKSYG